MDRTRSDAVALAWAHGLDEHGAQLDAHASARKLAEMELWLRRLVGKFRIEGHKWNLGTPNHSRGTDVRGTVDCFAIGDGPGVACMISADWKPRKAKTTDKARDIAVRPQLLLFGLDPGAMEIRVTHVDSIAVQMRGFLVSDAVILNPLSSLFTFVFAVDPKPMVDWGLGGGVGKPPSSAPAWRLVASEPLSPAPPKPVSRVAIAPGGDIDLKFYVLPRAPGLVEQYNQPIEFDLQLRPEPQVGAVGSGAAMPPDFTCAKTAASGWKAGLHEQDAAPLGVKEMQAWLERLVGRYTYEGYVDLCGKGDAKDRRAVTGKADCIAVNSSPSVHCRLDVSLPASTTGNGSSVLGGVSILAPAQVLFSLANDDSAFKRGGPDRWGLLVMKMDNSGVAEWASSELWGDTFMAKEQCIDISRSCSRITRVKAGPDVNEIYMSVDIEANKRRERQVLLLHRDQSIQKNVASEGSSP